MMLNETFTRNAQPRDPERIRSDVETPCATVYNQGVTPVLYDNAVQVSSGSARAVEYLPENTIALSVSECVMMLLVQLVPVLGLIMAAVWSFSPNSGINKRTVSRAMLIVQCIVLAVVCVFWFINYGFRG